MQLLKPYEKSIAATQNFIRDVRHCYHQNFSHIRAQEIFLRLRTAIMDLCNLIPTLRQFPRQGIHEESRAFNGIWIRWLWSPRRSKSCCVYGAEAWNIEMGKTTFAVASLSTETVQALEASLFADADKNLICNGLLSSCMLRLRRSMHALIKQWTNVQVLPDDSSLLTRRVNVVSRCGEPAKGGGSPRAIWLLCGWGLESWVVLFVRSLPGCIFGWRRGSYITGLHRRCLGSTFSMLKSERWRGRLRM